MLVRKLSLMSGTLNMLSKLLRLYNICAHTFESHRPARLHDAHSMKIQMKSRFLL